MKGARGKPEMVIALSKFVDSVSLQVVEFHVNAIEESVRTHGYCRGRKIVAIVRGFRRPSIIAMTSKGASSGAYAIK
jgi:hypothetical protein